MSLEQVRTTARSQAIFVAAMATPASGKTGGDYGAIVLPISHLPRGLRGTGDACGRRRYIARIPEIPNTAPMCRVVHMEARK